MMDLVNSSVTKAEVFKTRKDTFLKREYELIMNGLANCCDC